MSLATITTDRLVAGPSVVVRHSVRVTVLGGAPNAVRGQPSAGTWHDPDTIVVAGCHVLGGVPGLAALLRFPDEPRSGCVYLDNRQGALYLERPADIEAYASVFERTAAVALDDAGSLACLATLRERAQVATGEGGT